VFVFVLYIGAFRNLAVGCFLDVACLSYAAEAWVKAQANVPLCGTIKLTSNLEH
jgi:hypothetical protein